MTLKIFSNLNDSVILSRKRISAPDLKGKRKIKISGWVAVLAHILQGLSFPMCCGMWWQQQQSYNSGLLLCFKLSGAASSSLTKRMRLLILSFPPFASFCLGVLGRVRSWIWWASWVPSNLGYSKKKQSWNKGVGRCPVCIKQVVSWFTVELSLCLCRELILLRVRQGLVSVWAHQQCWAPCDSFACIPSEESESDFKRYDKHLVNQDPLSLFWNICSGGTQLCQMAIAVENLFLL